MPLLHRYTYFCRYKKSGSKCYYTCAIFSWVYSRVPRSLVLVRVEWHFRRGSNDIIESASWLVASTSMHDPVGSQFSPLHTPSLLKVQKCTFSTSAPYSGGTWFEYGTEGCLSRPFEVLLRSTVNWPQSLLSKYCKSCKVIILRSKQVVHILDKVSLNKRPRGGDVLTDTSVSFNLPSFEILT